MEPSEVHALAVAAGLTHEQAITATAIAWAESNLNPNAVGDLNLQDDTWGPSMGLYQVRSLKADTGTGKVRDAKRLLEPAFNSRSMVTISGGTDWTPWSVWKNGRYAEHVDAVRAAVQETPMRFVSREGWGARSATTSTNITPEGVAIHWEGPHMGTPEHDDCAARVRGIQAYHMDNNSWADVAYSAIVCPHGYVFEGRGIGHRTAANGTNEGNQSYYAVCYLGGEGDPFTDEAKVGINDAIGWLGGGALVGHRDLTSTACPGAEIYAWVQDAGPPPDPDPVPQGDPMALTFRYIFDGLDFVFDGPSQLYFQCDDTAQITEVLDVLKVPALGKVSPATHKRYSELAKTAGFAG